MESSGDTLQTEYNYGANLKILECTDQIKELQTIIRDK